jgi:hypothetical protein
LQVAPDIEAGPVDESRQGKPQRERTFTPAR